MTQQNAFDPIATPAAPPAPNDAPTPPAELPPIQGRLQITPVLQAGAVLPIAEPGDETIEFKVVRIFCLADETALGLGVAAAAGGLIHPSAELMTFAGLAVQSINGLVISAFAIARGVRKQGTTA